MMPCKLLLHCIVLSLLLTSASLRAQSINESRWWAGLKSGICFTSAHPIARYSSFEYTNSLANPDKKYATLFKGKGPLIAISIDYAILPNLAVSIQPAYQNYAFSYISKFSWYDTTSQKVELTNTHVQKMHYLELPLLIKAGYSFGKFRAHVQGGAYYGRLLSAKKTVASSEKYYDTTSVIPLNNFKESFDLAGLYIPSQIGIIAGAGISFDINYFRVSLECNYRYGLNNITSVKNRYSDQRLVSGIYDVPDDIKLRNLEFALHCSTPLDYLMHMPGFSAKPMHKR